MESNKRRRKRDTDITATDYEEIIEHITELNISENKNILNMLTRKIDNLEKKFEEINRLYIKMDLLNKKIDKIYDEKDYIIYSLKDEAVSLKDEIVSLKDEIKYNNNDNDNKIYDYFS